MSHAKNIETSINQYYFMPAGYLELPDGGGLPKFDLNAAWVRKGNYAKVTGLVYLWVKYNDAGIVDIAYVGKAGKTLKGRCTQHRGGFSGANGKTGQNNATRITDWLSVPGNRLMLWARPSATQLINDESVCMVSVDEESFIQKFRNAGCELWNFQAS